MNWSWHPGPCVERMQYTLGCEEISHMKYTIFCYFKINCFSGGDTICSSLSSKSQYMWYIAHPISGTPKDLPQSGNWYSNQPPLNKRDVQCGRVVGDGTEVGLCPLPLTSRKLAFRCSYTKTTLLRSWTGRRSGKSRIIISIWSRNASIYNEYWKNLRLPRQLQWSLVLVFRWEKIEFRFWRNL